MEYECIIYRVDMTQQKRRLRERNKEHKIDKSVSSIRSINQLLWLNNREA